MYHLIENLKNIETLEYLIFIINTFLSVFTCILYFLNAIIIKFTVIKNIEKHYKVKLIPFPNTMGGFRLEYSCIALELAFYVPYCFIKKLFISKKINNTNILNFEKTEIKNTALKKGVKKKKSKKVKKIYYDRFYINEIKYNIRDEKIINIAICFLHLLTIITFIITFIAFFILKYHSWDKYN